MAYVISVGFFVLAVLTHLLFDPWVDNRYLLSFIAVVFSALYGGRGPAAMVMVLSVLLEYLLNRVLVATPPSWNTLALVLYVLPSVAAIAFIGRVSTAARRRSEGRAAQLSGHGLAREIERAQGRHAERQIVALNQELQRRIKEVQTLVEANPIPICWTFDPQGREICGNRAYRHTFGMAPEGRGGRAALAIFRDGCELPLEKLPLRRCLESGQPIEGEDIEVVRPDGKRFAVIATALPLCSGDRMRGAIGVMVDITERKRAELERAQGERRKDEFLAMLAHELRNPLAPIRNALEIVQQEGERRLPWALKLIERQLHQLTRITDDLLELARIVRGQIVLKQETVDVGAVIARAVETSRPFVETRRHTLHVDVPQESTWINGDIARLTQALSNLLNNAARYTPEGGAIFVKSRAADGMAELRVRDTGRGIEPAVLPRIFESFVRGEQSVARSDGGLGIGLTIAKRIAELHKGTLTAHSPGPNKGSEFVIKLPLAQRLAAPQGDSRHVPADYPRRRVLIVDDNEDVADSVAVLLKLRGHTTEQHYAGEGAIEKAETFEPNVVILDLGLPGLDGYGLARLFRAHPRLQGCFLIAMSGYGQPADLQNSAAAGFDCHLLKPADPPVLFELIERTSATAQAPTRTCAPTDTQGRSPVAH